MANRKGITFGSASGKRESIDPDLRATLTNFLAACKDYELTKITLEHLKLYLRRKRLQIDRAEVVDNVKKAIEGGYLRAIKDNGKQYLYLTETGENVACPDNSSDFIEPTAATKRSWHLRCKYGARSE